MTQPNDCGISEQELAEIDDYSAEGTVIEVEE